MKKLLCFILIFSLIFTLAVPHASAVVGVDDLALGVGICVAVALGVGMVYQSSGTSSQSFNDYMGEQVQDFVDSRGGIFVDTFGTAYPTMTQSGLTIPHSLMNGALDFLNWWKSENNLSSSPTSIIDNFVIDGVNVVNQAATDIGRFPCVFFTYTPSNITIKCYKQGNSVEGLVNISTTYTPIVGVPSITWGLKTPATNPAPALGQNYIYTCTVDYDIQSGGKIQHVHQTYDKTNYEFYLRTNTVEQSNTTVSIGADTDETLSDLQAYTEDYEFTLQGVEGDTVEEVLNNVVDSVVTQPLPGIIIIPQPIVIPEPSPPPSPSPSPSPSPNPSPAPIIVPEYPPEYEPLFPDEVRPITTQDIDTWNKETFLPYIAPLTQITKVIQDAIDAIKDTITSIKDKITSSSDTTTDIIEDIQTEPDAPETYQVTLKQVFPFCIPFDIYNMVLAFDSEPVPPHFEVPMHFPWVDIDYTWEIDLSDWSSVAAVLRELEYIAFCVGLAILTSKVIKW